MGTAAFTVVSKLGAVEEGGPGGIHHPQDRRAALFRSLTEGPAGQASVTRRKEKGDN